MLAWQVITEAMQSQSTDISWANPKAKVIKQVSTTTAAQGTPNLFDNMDCSVVTYRTPTTNSMVTGCFTESALGLIESDSDIAIFNGTDEGLLLAGYSPHQVLVPWPGSSDLIALDPLSTGGTYISIYKNPMAHVSDQRNYLQELIGKQLTSPPEVQIRDKLGQKLVVNPQTLAFSDGGSWLVAETVNGSFVRINLSSMEIKPFAQSYSMSGSPAQLKSRLSITQDGRFVAIYNKDSTTFRVYDLSNCASTSVNLEPENCAVFDYLPFIQPQISGLTSIRRVRFVNAGLLSFEATSSSTNAGGIYVIAPTDSINSLIDYLGLGDSYTSGEGAYDYLSGTDTPDNMCHLSIRSYPLLITNDLFSSTGGHNVACSGAVLNDLASHDDNYKGQVRNVLDFKHLTDTNPGLLNSIMTNYLPGYVAQQRFVKQYQPAVLTVSAGGDDIGFGDILQQCVAPHLSIHPSNNDCFNTYEDRLEVLQLIDRTSKKWLSAFRQLKDLAPLSNLYVIGYPQIAYDKGNCALNVHLSKSEMEFGTELINYLNQSIQKAATDAGAQYVDISHALDGHRLCETASHDMAMNGLTAGKDAGVLGLNFLGKESYHPNILGQRMMEQSILSKTRNLTLLSKNNSTVPETTSLLNAPKTGRKIMARTPGRAIANRVVSRGEQIQLKASGSNYGLRSSAQYALNLDGPSGKLIGYVTTDASGNIDQSITIPPSAEPGGHTIDTIGKGQSDETTDITQPVYIVTTPTDSDGDNIPDTSDSCPHSVNSGQDTDADGIDDSCDGFIGQPPTPPFISSTGQSTPASTPREVTISDGPGTTPPSLSVGPSTVSSSIVLQDASAAKPAKHNSRVSNSKNTAGDTTVKSDGKPSNSFEKAKLPKINVTDFNWLAWIIGAVLVWLCLIIIGLYIENFHARESAAA